jgi:hypothetical protein
MRTHSHISSSCLRSAEGAQASPVAKRAPLLSPRAAAASLSLRAVPPVPAANGAAAPLRRRAWDAADSSSAPSPKPAAPRSPPTSWRGGAPASELVVVNFFRALQAGDEGGAAALLARAPGLANVARGGTLPLHAAVRAKSLPLAQLLVRAGADARAVDGAGNTAAAVAAAHGAASLAAWLEGAAARQ